MKRRGKENLTGEDGMEFRVCASLALGIDTPSDSDGQPPEIATWSPSSEYLYLWKYTK